MVGQHVHIKTCLEQGVPFAPVHVGLKVYATTVNIAGHVLGQGGMLAHAIDGAQGKEEGTIGHYLATAPMGDGLQGIAIESVDVPGVPEHGEVFGGIKLIEEAAFPYHLALSFLVHAGVHGTGIVEMYCVVGGIQGLSIELEGRCCCACFIPQGDGGGAEAFRIDQNGETIFCCLAGQGLAVHIAGALAPGVFEVDQILPGPGQGIGHEPRIVLTVRQEGGTKGTQGFTAQFQEGGFHGEVFRLGCFINGVDG